MKIEPEAEPGEVRGPCARERASIGRPTEWQPQGCGGCGSEGQHGSLFDCEHFQFIDDDDEGVICDDEPPATQAPAPMMGEDEPPPKPRSLLRKGPRQRRNRVTFDEAVAMYSDEGGVQLLQLTTGPDVIYSDCYYMFEPPIEYRDLPPFEPPAEYRDSDETSTPTNEPEEDSQPPAAPSDPDEAESAAESEPTPADEQASEPAPDPAGDDAAATPEAAGDNPTLESDRVFERFLEAEREFAVDEELNDVFRALEGDLVNDDKHGALDDNFFRKLITLLSSAEGGAPAGPDPDPADDDDNNGHSRTLSEADSDCSISSQDTIIARLGEDEPDPLPPSEAPTPGSDERPARSSLVSQAVARIERAGVVEESLSRQSSGEQSVASQDHPQDADDSTSSDSRSGEVEEDIRLDDLGYDEEDADDYDEESFRGMARGSSKIRRIIKKNALQCSLFRGIEAKRRQVPGARLPRPKSPLLSQESLVEKLRWLTTVEEPPHPHSKPPDVILSTGGVPVNGAEAYQPAYYPPRHAMPPAGYYPRRDGFPPTLHPSLPRQRAFAGHPPQATHTLPRPQDRVPHHPAPPLHQQQQQQWPEQQQRPTTVPRSFRDWRVIQRLIGGRSKDSGGEGRSAPAVPADYVRSPNGSISAYPLQSPPDVSRTGRDELEQFVEKDSRRMELIRRRYSLADEEDDPTFGFARRPSVKGVQKQIHPRQPAYEDLSWRPDHLQQPPYEPAPLHRASVALPGSATIPYAHRKPPPQDLRYHSYAESVYGSARTLGWLPPNPAHPMPPPMLQVPVDERGVPEGASSSPKISSDSLYHSPVPEAVGPHKEDGVVYYSLNV